MAFFMLKMKRKEFLIQFLGALGANDIEWSREQANDISGRVIYDKNDPEEIQDFCWNISENDVPNSSVLDLVKLINEKGLLRIDQISVTRDRLREMYNGRHAVKVSEKEFSDILEELQKVKVPLIEGDVEFDFYFIHE